MAQPALRQLDTRRRRATVVYAGVGAWLLSWSALMTATDPSSAAVGHWNVAWCGLDLGEACAALATAWLTARGDRRAARAAMALAVLLCVDAWFDVCSAAPGLARAVAVAEAVVLELPLAGATAWWSTRVEAQGAPVVTPQR